MIVTVVETPEFQRRADEIMSEEFKSIKRGLEEAVAFARRQGKATVHEIDVSQPDVRAVRTRTGLSQVDFARSIGIKKATLLNWEQRRRSPQGPARVLLAMIDKDPGIVQRMLVDGKVLGTK